MEYLAVAAGVSAAVVALGALVRWSESGGLVRLATRAASHAVGGVDRMGALLDVFLH